ncbi:ead/Ea22-like family protein [Citrobacter freundii]|uniref:ead/Ea22-like family protein n=1 Tax=Citrobacter freundii TaxID=546 RepID=UPI0028C2E74E|nr:ead/Ea22-like family protein [Citrobacter freundii]MDT7393441.1 ead/Ea22-like family protein [Citrobacter freundii]MDT7398653.1 ead/Ea22-like family protein [Citrobacter freundii]
MTALNKQALLRAAVKIGAHTWEAEGSQVWSISNGTADSLVLEVFGDKTSGQQDCDIASFIAAANSATVLALLDELEAAEKRIAEQREYYEGVIADGSRRIAELEARSVTLPPTFWYEHDDLSRDVPVLDKRLVKKAIRAAGIGVKGE